MKWCVATTLLLINRTTASVEEQCGDRQMPREARAVKRCESSIIHAVDRHPSIKVQRDQRYVICAHRLKQPILVDLTASLTQRKNAEATGVRHHVQAHRVHQRNDTLVIVESTSADRHVEPLDAQLRQCFDDGFLQCLQRPALFPNLHIHLLLPCQTRRDVHVVMWSFDLFVGEVVAQKSHRSAYCAGRGTKSSQQGREAGLRKAPFYLEMVDKHGCSTRLFYFLEKGY